eukprot:c24388_g1_i1.p1 GENE.c24388_g1_i1~~c24388_g1_i1.p1  ORF type:complete len:128 (+),score=49.69 c24388_g1_i1:44-385(+)
MNSSKERNNSKKEIDDLFGVDSLFGNGGDISMSEQRARFAHFCGLGATNQPETPKKSQLSQVKVFVPASYENRVEFTPPSSRESSPSSLSTKSPSYTSSSSRSFSLQTDWSFN